MLTAALRATCLQLKPSGPPWPFRALSRLGHAGLDAPVSAAADLARMAGRNKLSAVQDKYVMEPEKP
jgi:hypothetical protein